MFNSSRLTAAQVRVVSLMASGMHDQEIADTLFLSLHTVRHYIDAARTVVGARTRPHLISLLTLGSSPDLTPEWASWVLADVVLDEVEIDSEPDRRSAGQAAAVATHASRRPRPR